MPLHSRNGSVRRARKKTNWIHCTTLILDPRHKAETFDLTPWGSRELKKESLRKFEFEFESTKSTSIKSQCRTVACQDCYKFLGIIVQ